MGREKEERHHKRRDLGFGLEDHSDDFMSLHYDSSFRVWFFLWNELSEGGPQVMLAVYTTRPVQHGAARREVGLETQRPPQGHRGPVGWGGQAY